MTIKTFPTHSKPLDTESKALRLTIIKMVQIANRGHIGAAFSLVEILRVLYNDVLRYDARDPKWCDRDRFILSKGHGCLALYPILAQKGFFPEAELWKFCQSDGILGGHPEHSKVPGIEASTGSLGHGLSIGVGFALNAQYENSTYRTFVLIGDGESNEGAIWEAAMCASKHKLNNLTIIVDYNKQQSYSSTFEVLDLEPLVDKWKSFGFAVIEADGHDVDQLRTQFSKLPLSPDKPAVVICHTIKGKGVSFIEGNLSWHHKNKIKDEEVQAIQKELE